MNIPIELIFFPVFMLASAFFSGFETGILSINRHRLLHLVRGGSRRAEYIAHLLGQPHRLLATTLVGNNIANVVLSTLAANIGARAAGATGQTLAAPVAAIVLLIFGEYLPKVWSTAHPLRRILPLAPVFRVVDFLFYPIAAAIAFITIRLDPRRKSDTRSPFVSRDNIKILVRDSQAQGNISPFERLLINRVLELQLQQAWQLMTPLAQIISVGPEHTLADCREIALSARHSRFPVLQPGANPPLCLGVVQLSDIARQTALDTPVRDLMHPARIVDMHTPADDLLPFMRIHHEGMLLLKDRHNHLRGLITQEDLLTALIDGLRTPSTDRAPEPLPQPQ